MKRKTTAAIFGTVLRQIRKDQSLTQDELALRSGLDRTYISLLELGQRSPSLETLLALARGLKIPLADIANLVEARLSARAPDSKQG